MTAFYKGKTVLVTGGTGFVGSHLVRALLKRQANVLTVGRRPRPSGLDVEVKYCQADLTDRRQCLQVLSEAEMVFHLAASGAGFHANLHQQAKILTEDLLINTTVLDSAATTGVDRLLLTSSIAVYPAHLCEPSEEDPWDSEPSPGECYYGWAKRMAEIQARSIYEHIQMPIAIVRLSNPYGPGDNFDPQKAHVIPALIRRAVREEHPFVVWGSGRPQRSFIHVDDVVRGMLLALEHHAVCDPVNLASDKGLSIAELVQTLLAVTGNRKADIVFDTSKPDGPLKRLPSSKKMIEVLGAKPRVDIRTGLAQTVQWYRAHHNGKKG